MNKELRKMGKLISKKPINKPGIMPLFGKPVMVFCLNYIYSGILQSIRDGVIHLQYAMIVYETGSFDSDKFTDAQKLPHDVYIMISAIESISETNKSASK